jgi:hypothetical protein
MTNHSGPLSENEMVPQKSNRPPLRKRKEGILVHDTGFSGPGRIRQLGDYKGELREGDFHHRYELFAGPGEEEDDE